MSNLIKDYNLDVNSICRICLEKVNESTDLFSNTGESLEILRKISECFQIILNSEKYLPCVICTRCVNELDNANSFRLKCVTINERFKDHCEKFMKNLKKQTCKQNKCNPQTEHNNLCLLINEDNDEKGLCDDMLSEVGKNSNFKCEKCHKVLKSKKSLLKHIASMHEKRRHIGKVSGFGLARRYYCSTCSYSTPHSQTLVNHMRTHNGERPYTCDCGKNFTQASSLAAHHKTHSNTTFFTCSQCGKQFKHAFSLKTHQNVHSTGNYTCNICSKILKSQNTLNTHMKRHYKVYNYNCEDCGATFVTSAELNNHRLKHSAEKKVQCHICNYVTNTKKNLTVHLKRHVGNRTSKCYFCEKSFYSQGDLQRHMRVHTREKAFSCQTCSQRFTYSSSLNKHMLTIHGTYFKWGDAKCKEAMAKNT